MACWKLEIYFWQVVFSLNRLEEIPNQVFKYETLFDFDVLKRNRLVSKFANQPVKFIT